MQQMLNVGIMLQAVKSFGKMFQSTSLAMTCGAYGDAAPVYNVEIIENMADDPGTENATLCRILEITQRLMDSQIKVLENYYKMMI